MAEDRNRTPHLCAPLIGLSSSGFVILDFGEAIQWVAFTAEDAEALASLLRGAAAALRRRAEAERAAARN